MLRDLQPSERAGAWRARLVHLTGAIACAILLGSPGLAQRVGTSFGDSFGRSLARVDDLDCDGIADFAVGAPYSRSPRDLRGWTPRVFLYSGRSGALIRELASVSLGRKYPAKVPEDPEMEGIGLDVANAPDIDGDGFGEIVSGRVVFSGFSGHEILVPRIKRPRNPTASSLAPPAPVGETKTAQIARLFLVPASVKDRQVIEAAFELVRPRPDLLGRLGWWPAVSAPTSDRAPLAGARLSVERLLPPQNGYERNALVLRPLNSQASIVYSGECPRRDFAEAIAWIGDVDQDGASDFAISDFWRGTADRDGPKEPCDGGRVFVHSGRTGARMRTLGDQESPWEFGFALAGGDDLDADGVPDLLIGTNVWIGGQIEAFSGRTGKQIFQIFGDTFDSLGVSLAFLGDVNGDGVSDFASGSADTDENCWGEVIVYSGHTRAVLYRVHSPYLSN